MAFTPSVTPVGSDLNELIFTEVIPVHFAPPRKDEIKVTITRDGVEDEVDIPRDAITIDPDNQEPSPAHTIVVSLKDLIANDAIKGFKPSDTVIMSYPITAVKPDAGVIFSPDVLYQANTLPAGKPLEVRFTGKQAVAIPVVHVRRKYHKGKEIHGLGAEGSYEIVLFVKNTGEFNLENITVI